MKQVRLGGSLRQGKKVDFTPKSSNKQSRGDPRNRAQSSLYIITSLEGNSRMVIPRDVGPSAQETTETRFKMGINKTALATVTFCQSICTYTAQ